MQGLPTSENLLQAALQASWQRDREVAERRLAWRWTLWGATRWGGPVVLAAVLGYVPVASLVDGDLMRAGLDAALVRLKLATTLDAAHDQPAAGTRAAQADVDAGIALKPEFQLNSKENK